MKWLLEKVRRGETVTITDKIRSETSLEVLDGMVAAWAARGVELNDAERAEAALRRVEIMKGARRCRG